MTHVKFNHRPYNRSFNNFVDELFTDFPVLFKNDATAQQGKGFVPVNILETEKGYTIHVIAPGFEKTDFKVNLDQHLLTISAEKKEEVKDEKEKNIRNEYRFGSFKRSFTLDDKIAADSIEAKYVNGVLTLNLPRKEQEKPASKDISIQ